MDGEARSTLSVKKTTIGVPRLTHNLAMNLRTGGGEDPSSPKTIPKTFLPPKTHDHLAYFGNTNRDYFSKITIRSCVRSMAAIFESEIFQEGRSAGKRSETIRL